jgi:hypothetical protein
MTKRQQVESDEVNMALVKQKVDFVAETVSDIKIKLESNYATKEWCESKYSNTTKIVNGMLITFGTAIVLAIVGWMVRGGLAK